MPSGRIRAWLAATRPKTLVAGAAPILVGTAFAYRHGAFEAVPAAAALTGALLIQIGTNLANDYHDFVRGADTPQRAGPARASASGAIAPRHVLAGALVAFALAALVGLYLAWVAGWPILVVGVAALLSGYAYTAGPYPLGYHGWGDAFVFVFFGLVAVAGTYFVQAGVAPPDVLVGAVPVGALATAVLVVNNLRDIDTDRAAGKRTLAVRLGRQATRIEYVALLLVGCLGPMLLWGMGHGPWVLLPALMLPFAILLARKAARVREARELNPVLGQTALLLGLVGVLLALGVALG